MLKDFSLLPAIDVYLPFSSSKSGKSDRLSHSLNSDPTTLK
jgi:hypothetical protein